MGKSKTLLHETHRSREQFVQFRLVRDFFSINTQNGFLTWDTSYHIRTSSLVVAENRTVCSSSLIAVTKLHIMSHLNKWVSEHRGVMAAIEIPLQIICHFVILLDLRRLQHDSSRSLC